MRNVFVDLYLPHGAQSIGYIYKRAEKKMQNFRKTNSQNTYHVLRSLYFCIGAKKKTFA